MVRSLNAQEFERLRPCIGVLIVTAVDVEEAAVQARLEDIAPDHVTGVFRYLQIGYFGGFLAAHLHLGEAGGTDVAVEVTDALRLLCHRHESRSVFVLMPGILCGLRRHPDDDTAAPVSALKPYVPELARSGDRERGRLLRKILAQAEGDSLVIPRLLTPEEPEAGEGQFLGDILLATRIIEHDLYSARPEGEAPRAVPIPAAPIMLKIRRQFPDWARLAAGRVPQLHSGLIASGDQLVRSFSSRERIRTGAATRDALGVEMEGHGLARSVHRFQTRIDHSQAWYIFAKAISDWGVVKADSGRRQAAENSVGFLHHCLTADPEIFDGLAAFADPSEIRRRLDIAHRQAEDADDDSWLPVPPRPIRRPIER